MLKWSLCDYRGAYILVNETITAAPQAGYNPYNNNNNNKEVVFKNCTISIDCIREINNIQIDNAN